MINNFEIQMFVDCVTEKNSTDKKYLKIFKSLKMV